MLTVGESLSVGEIDEDGNALLYDDVGNKYWLPLDPPVGDDEGADAGLVAALRRIRDARDNAAVGEGPAVPDGYDCFDDWAADLAGDALDAAGHSGPLPAGEVAAPQHIRAAEPDLRKALWGLMELTCDNEPTFAFRAAWNAAVDALAKAAAAG
jgi:hypothetical protein